MWKAKIMSNLTARDLGRPFISLVLLTINEKFYKISFLSQTLAMVFFYFPSISMKGTASNIYNNVIERYKYI